MATRNTIAVDCQVKECSNTPDDFAVYNLQDALVFNGTAISILAECPTGYYCAPGTFPRVFTYPPGTFTVPIPPTDTGFPIVIGIRGCESYLNTTLPAGSTRAQVVDAANVLISQAAAQQARCDAITFAGPRRPTAITLSDISEYACADVVFDATITASASPSGAPYTMALLGAPAWMTSVQNPAGTQLILGGTPTTIGAVTFAVQATSNGWYGAKSYTVNVVGIDTASPLPDAAINGAYSNIFDGSSIPGTLVWTVIAGALPAWLSLNSSTGEIFGTPALADLGVSNFTIQASNGTQSCSKAFQLTAICCFSNGNPPDADTTPVAYNFQLVPCQAADPTYAYSITAGSLPPGITLNGSTGLLSGNPTTPGTYPFTVGVTGVAFPCSTDYTIEALCQPAITDEAPGHMGNLALGIAGTVTLGPFYIIQRTGAGKLIHFRATGTVYTRAGMTITYGTRVYNDETSVLIGLFGGNSLSGGGGGVCGAIPMNDEADLSLNSCTRYRFEPVLVITGAPLGACTSTFDYYATWV